MLRSTGAVFSLLLSGVLLGGCRKESSPSASGGSPTALEPRSPPASAPAGAPGGRGAEAGHRKMANCPSSVEGASTTIEDVDGGVAVTITGPSDAAAREIRLRASHLSEVSEKNPTEIRHTGEGEGGGGLGSCPVVLAGTRISFEELAGGAKLIVRPGKAEDLEKLRQQTRERHAKAPLAK